MLYPGLQSDLFNLQILQFSFVLFAAQFGLRLGVRLTTREIGAGFLLFFFSLDFLLPTATFSPIVLSDQ